MELSVKMRIAIVISALWLLIWLALAVDWQEMNTFLAMGIIPLIAFWGIAWIKEGMKKNQQARETLSQRLRTSV